MHKRIAQAPRIFVLTPFALIAITVAAFLALSGDSHTAEAFTLGLATNVPNNAGQTLTISNEAVQLTFISQEAGFDNEFGEALPTNQSFFLCHEPPGTPLDGGRIQGPTELRFYLTTPDQGFGAPGPETFFTGPGSNNRDNFAHARMTQIAPNTIRQEWEDLVNGGDQDFNDCVIDIVITPLATLTIQKNIVPPHATTWNFAIAVPDVSARVASRAWATAAPRRSRRCPRAPTRSRRRPTLATRRPWTAEQKALRRRTS